MSSQTTKTCVICGADCTDKPRIKDGSGRYACRACAEQKAKARKQSAQKAAAPAKPKAQAAASPAAASQDGAAMMEQWMSGSTQGKIALGEIERPLCKNCEHPMMPDQVICMGCGTNTQSGKKLRTQIKKADKEPKASGGGGMSLNVFAMGPLAAFGLMFALNALPGMLMFADISLFVVAVLVSGIAGLILTIATIIVAFQEDQALWGWALIANIIPLANLIAWLPTLIYVLILCPRPGYREAWWGQLLGTITMWAIAIANGGLSGDQGAMF